MYKAGARRRNPPAHDLEGAEGGEEAPAVTPEPGTPVTVPVETSGPEREESAAGTAAAAAPYIAVPPEWAAGAAAAQPVAALTGPDTGDAAALHLALKFSLRRREEGELPLAFRCSLLALAQAAYPDLYGRALDSMALGKLLDLARELGIALSINNDRQITSLAVAENIQAHLSLRQRPQMAACAGILAPDGGDTLAALAMPDRRGRGTGGRRPEQRGRPGPSRPQEADTVACFRCGQRGHIERGCRNAPGAFGKGTPPSPRPSLASGSGPQAPPE
ncbi:uncharacterized protein LOC133363050 [Lethenteron reissneri]|uniref:uncharacterized protein LOC133363050 n=1 Tax=Lethenteron reissneri TaxID=7753 RepID=UPI002AB71628|nr:uncharacterized protein LOC133363050 [Lethenteron reissneri]